MRKQTIFNVAKKRKRSGRTNYRKRVKLLKSGKLRLVIRTSLNNVVAQIIEFHPHGDKVLVFASSTELVKFGWKFSSGSIPASYLTGLLIGVKSKEKDIKHAILDIGLKTPTNGSRVFACLKGVIDAGLDIPFSEEVLPSDDRISGKHIADFASKLDKSDSHFSGYSKKNLDPKQIPKVFEDVKNKIKVK